MRIDDPHGLDEKMNPLWREIMSAQWRAFYNVTYPKLWGIETTDPRAVDAGLEILVAPCMPEHAAKTLADAYNFALQPQKSKPEETNAPTISSGVSDLTKIGKSE